MKPSILLTILLSVGFLLSVKSAHALLKQSPESVKSVESQQNRSALQTKYLKDQEDFYKKLPQITNLKRREALEKLNNRLVEVNLNRTSAMNLTLEKLKNIPSQVSSSSPSTDTLQKISSAQSAIDQAQEAVSRQASKRYTVSITSESNLKSDFGKTRAQLAKDLADTEKLVSIARKATREAVLSLKQTL